MANEFNTVPPINRLAPELLAEIFLLSLPGPDSKRIVPDITEVPLSLCYVCKKWREVAVTVPGLWNNWASGVDDWRSSTFVFRAKLFERLFVGSVNSPISSACKWWKDIHVSFRILWRNQFEAFFSHKLPRVENIQILTRYFNTGSDATSRKPILSRDISEPWLPRLRSIQLSRCDISLDDAWMILRHSPQMERCELSIGNSSSNEIYSNIFVLPQLRFAKFQVNADSNVDVSILLGKLSMPALESFGLHIFYLSRWPVLSAFFWSYITDFLRRSTPVQLVDLSISCPPYDKLSQEEFLNCLEVVPSVENILVSGVEFQDAFLDRLILIPYSDSLCPHLRTLEITGHLLFSVDHMAPMILSRTQYGNAELRRVKFESNDLIHLGEEMLLFPGILERVHRLGLDIKLGCYMDIDEEMIAPDIDQNGEIVENINEVIEEDEGVALENENPGAVDDNVGLENENQGIIDENAEAISH